MSARPAIGTDQVGDEEGQRQPQPDQDQDEIGQHAREYFHAFGLSALSRKKGRQAWSNMLTKSTMKMPRR